MASADEADLWFRAGIGRRVRHDSVVYPRHEEGCSVALDCHEERIDEGTLVIDAYDRASGAHVWQGQATGTVPDDHDPSMLEDAVRRLLADFPAPDAG